ncbi:MAG: insulinase family protein, partial [Alphaproteobacteria bacterium]
MLKKLALALIITISALAPARAEIFYTLDNGLKVYIKQVPNQKFIMSRLIVHKGFASDTKAGLAHLTEHLAFQNTDKYDYDYLSKLFLGRGKFVMNATTTRTSTEYDAFGMYTKSNLDEVNSVLSQILMHIKPTEKGIEKEKLIVEQERKLRKLKDGAT